MGGLLVTDIHSKQQKVFGQGGRNIQALFCFMKTVFEKGRRNNKAVLLVGNTVKSV
jgi:predicted RNA-binding protein YlqC (UPF0109 family)